jgi:hypothetical protein
MKKTTAKVKNNKGKKIEEAFIPEVAAEDPAVEEAPAALELDPDVLKVLVKPKKPKVNLDATDYIPELERADMEDDSRPDPGGY